MYLRDRSRLIDMYLCFIGYCQRKNLIEHLDIGVATASRDFKAYREAYPRNMKLNESGKRYEATPDFIPAYEHEIEPVLKFLTSEFWPIPHPNPGFGCPLSFQLPHGMSVELVSPITRAVANKSAVKIDYASTNKGHTTRVIYPHALMSNGLWWYTRAYDETHANDNPFRNFRLSRILSAQPVQGTHSHIAGQAMDAAWTQQVTVTLAPHPNHFDEKAFLRDLGLTGQRVANITTTSAIAGFLLSSLRVDCSPDHSLDHHQFPFCCLNLHELKGCESLKIAPGAR